MCWGCRFGISGWQSLTRPHVFDVDFRIFRFLKFCLRNCVIFGRRIFEIQDFWRENVGNCDFEISERKLMTRPHVFDVDFQICPFSNFCFRNCVFLSVGILEITFFWACAFLKLKMFGAPKSDIWRFPAENRWRVPTFSTSIFGFLDLGNFA